MKKIVGILLSVCLMLGAFSTLAGCGKKSESGDVVITILRGSADLTDTALVEAKVSELTNEKLGFGVKFKTLSILNALPYTNWLAANEEIDIMGAGFSSPEPFIKNKTFREIESLLTEENAPNLVGLEQFQKDLFFGKGVDGKTYGIGVMSNMFGAHGSYLVRRDVLEDAGLYGEGAGKYVDQDIIDYDDLDTIFAAIKALQGTAKGNGSGNYPSKLYPSGILGKTDPSNYLIARDAMTGSIGLESGALMSMDSTTVENFYKSDEYKEFVNKMGSWKEAEYIHPDADTTDETTDTLFNSGNFVGAFYDGTEQLKSREEVAKKTELVQLQFLAPYFINAGGVGMWHISSRSSRPIRAMKFIDLLCSDIEIMNTIQYGVEGVHWEWADEEALIITPTEEKPDVMNNGYYNQVGIYGDHSKIASWKGTGSLEEESAKKLAIKAADKIKSDAAVANPSVAVGFKYDPTKQSARISGITTIITQYAKTLWVGKGTKGGGDWTGIGSTYAAFIKALDDAKIDTVIADKQSQFDAWLAAKG